MNYAFKSCSQKVWIISRRALLWYNKSTEDEEWQARKRKLKWCNAENHHTWKHTLPKFVMLAWLVRHLPPTALCKRTRFWGSQLAAVTLEWSYYCHCSWKYMSSNAANMPDCWRPETMQNVRAGRFYFFSILLTLKIFNEENQTNRTIFHDL